MSAPHDVESYLDDLHAQAEELVDRARTAEALHDAPHAADLRARATALVRKAARVRAGYEED